MDYVVILPLIIGFSSQLFSKKFSENKLLPSWVFSVVWTILYLLLGIAWYYSLKGKNWITNGYLYSSLIILLFIWPIVYTRIGPKFGLYLFLLIFMNLFYCLLFGDIFSRICLIPLLTWLIFAFLLNFDEVNNQY